MEHASLTIDGAFFEVLTLRGEEALSTLFSYEVECAHDGALDPGDLVGRPAVVQLVDGLGGERSVRGIVAEAAVETFELGTCELVAVVRPAAFRASVGRDCRVFHDADVAAIAERVLADAGIAARRELGRSYGARPYTVQWRESDWSFLSRLFEDEGIFYWFDEGLLVLSDDSTGAPDLAGGAPIRASIDAGMASASELVLELGPVLTATSDAVQLRAFDPERPLLRSSGAEGQGRLEVYDAPMGVPAAQVSARARVRAEAAAARRRALAARTNGVRVVPGRTLSILDAPAPSLGGEQLVTAVSVRVDQRRRGTAEATERALEVRFEAMPAEVPYRAPHRTPRPIQAGLQSGVVVGPGDAEVHPDASGRVRAQLHWDREGRRDAHAGAWMRVAQRGTAGSMLLPRVGWNVMALHEEGSPDAPMVMSRVFDAEHPPPYALPAHKTQTAYKTATTPGGGSFNEIRFEDRAGAEEMLVHASRDMGVLVQNDKTEAVSAQSTRSVGNDERVTVGGNDMENVAGNQTVTIGADETDSVAGAREVVVSGDESSRVGGGRRLKVGAGAETAVVGARSVSVGAAQIDASVGSVAATAPTMKVLVGGVLVRVTPRGITETVGTTVTAGTVSGRAGQAASLAAASLLSGVGAGVGGSIQTVLGAKVELAAGSRNVGCGKKLVETVGGALVMQSLDFTDRAADAWSLAVAGRLSCSARHVLVKAERSIALSCGEAKIVVSELGVTITAPTVDLSSVAALKAKGAHIEQN
jgi:type VI secretion system secreted protein VgrG